MTIDDLIAGHDVSAKRQETLAIAIAAGVDDRTLAALRDARRVNRRDTIILPAHRFEGLSRGRGWARQGRGDGAVWGERTDQGYRVGPGRWVVGATDGFARQAQDGWTVRHVTVGTATWTMAE